LARPSAPNGYGVVLPGSELPKTATAVDQMDEAIAETPVQATMGLVTMLYVPPLRLERTLDEF
jgi:hypothetical protein